MPWRTDARSSGSLPRTPHFFTLVSLDSREEAFAHHRKLFLTEQGYSYEVVIHSETGRSARGGGNAGMRQ
ncbi:MAG: hypothetical protein FJ109_11815 [Deltaproteobacteria bacterium]|nr:hypothetical protein [Deltaproteobacteria bacterium]